MSPQEEGRESLMGDAQREFLDELELLRQRDEFSGEQRVRRYLEVKRQGIIPDHHFSQASTECIDLYRDGHFIATVMATQAVNEGILKLVAERNRLPYKERNFRDYILDLKTSPLLDIFPYACLEASRKIWDSFRNDVHHMNPKVSQIPFQKLAKENIQRLALVEREVFGGNFQDGQLVPKHPLYWDVSKDGTAPVFLRHPRV